MTKIIDEAIEHFPDEIRSRYRAPYTIYHSPGCQECNGNGIVGRIAVFEVLEMSREIGEIIETDPTTRKLIEAARRQGMITLREDGILKALQGVTSLEAVLRLTAD